MVADVCIGMVPDVGNVPCKEVGAGGIGKGAAGPTGREGGIAEEETGAIADREVG
jgi:hypothetical protein